MSSGDHGRTRLHGGPATFWLVVAAFLGPLVAAWWLVGHWQPPGRTEHGQLLDPARPLTGFSAHDTAGEDLDLDGLRGRWTLIHVDADGRCGPACRDSLYVLRQTRLALGRNMERVHNLLLLGTPADAALAAWLTREHPELQTAVGEGTALARPFEGGVAGAWTYLVDPLGNLVMRYPGDVNGKGLLQDLRRLLKLSKIG